MPAKSLLLALLAATACHPPDPCLTATASTFIGGYSRLTVRVIDTCNKRSYLIAMGDGPFEPALRTDGVVTDRQWDVHAVTETVGRAAPTPASAIRGRIATKGLSGAEDVFVDVELSFEDGATPRTKRLVVATRPRNLATNQ